MSFFVRVNTVDSMIEDVETPNQWSSDYIEKLKFQG